MVEFQNVSKVYPDGTTAVEDFSLVCPSGETTVLVGTSGSGKTTLLRMVNRMVEPTSGKVLWDGQDVAQMEAVKLRRKIGYVLQEGGLLPHRSVLDNIATVPLLDGANRSDALKRASELLNLVGLDASLGNRYPAQLSGGQRQRVGVARALANKPLLMLMDEPFGALDPLVRRDLQKGLIQIREELGTTILLVTHDIAEAVHLGHQIVVMRTGGKVAQVGTPDDILNRPANQFVSDLVEAGRL